MRSSIAQSLALALGFMVLAMAHADAGLAPDRIAHRHSVTSTHDPKVQIELPVTATYIGADRWLLKAYADDIELHAFVDADTGKHVQHLYWVQFEAYLPSRPELKHTYDSPRHVTLGGMDFFVDSWVESTDSTDEPDSDSTHLKALLHGAGYTLPRSMLSVRFVHVMDGARKELMFIYSEDAAPTGFTATDLKKGGKAYNDWPEIEAGLIQRGQSSMQFH